jgi:hypothetical protein
MASAPKPETRIEAAPRERRARLRAILLAVVGVLYLLSVPWYRDPAAPLRLILGLPDWVAVALGCYVLAAVLNAWAWLLADVDDERDIGEVLPHVRPEATDGAPRP